MEVRLQLQLEQAGWLLHFFHSQCMSIITFVENCFNVIRAFASKANLITALTGVSHEKLQVFHRFTSWAMFVLALVHTFPFIILHIVKGDMMTLWTTSVVYWTGVAALIPQAWLTIMSIGPLRYFENQYGMKLD